MILSHQSACGGAKRQRMAMTLIELIAAVTLSAFMMVALCGVLRGLHLQENQTSKMVDRKWPVKLVHLLHRDLLTADSVFSRNGAIWLEGRLPTYSRLPASERIVRYEVVDLGNASALARNDSGNREFFAIGATALKVERIDRQGVTQPLSTRRGPVPSQVRVWVKNEGRMEKVGDIPLQAGTP